MKRIIGGIVLACISSMAVVIGLINLGNASLNYSNFSTHDSLMSRGIIVLAVSAVCYVVSGLLIYFGIQGIVK
jgi:hypothetical protein